MTSSYSGENLAIELPLVVSVSRCPPSDEAYPELRLALRVGTLRLPADDEGRILTSRLDALRRALGAFGMSAEALRRARSDSSANLASRLVVASEALGGDRAFLFDEPDDEIEDLRDSHSRPRIIELACLQWAPPGPDWRPLAETFLLEASALAVEALPGLLEPDPGPPAFHEGLCGDWTSWSRAAVCAFESEDLLNAAEPALGRRTFPRI